MLPKVSLLRPSWATYSFAFGKSFFNFRGGKEKNVPVVVALELKKKLGSDRKPLFQVMDLPTIVKSNKPKQKVIKQNERSSGPRQLALATPWPLEAL